jgi:hypothetical protein
VVFDCSFPLLNIEVFSILKKGCCVNLNSSNSVSNKENVKDELENISNHTFPSNIITTRVPEAEKVPKQFYQYLNEKKYEQVSDLFGPNLKFYGHPSNRKYLKNLEVTTFKSFKDVSETSYQLSRIQESYYAIKVYSAKLNIKVIDPNLVANFAVPQNRRFVVIQKKKNDPWLLDSEEDYSDQW